MVPVAEKVSRASSQRNQDAPRLPEDITEQRFESAGLTVG
jgi:hypothetical protein